MFLLCMVPLLLMIITGFALYAEGQGMDHWMFAVFGWVIPLFGGSFMVHTVHHIGMWVLIVFSCIHTYLVFREDIMGRTSIISTMVSGWRFMKDDKP
jgi:Ni/Fe-hydrogenase 1 B-type cytochrome subunit